MKSFLIFLVLVSFYGFSFADGPCYYKIEVEGDCECDSSSGLTCPDGVSGMGIYKKYPSSAILYPVLSEFGEAWSFSQVGSSFSIRTSEELIFCEGIIQNQGSSADPNFLDCEASEGSFVFDVYGYDSTIDDNIAKFTVTISILCSCEDYFNQVAGMSYDAEDENLPCDCDCETDPACGASDDLEDNQGELKPDQVDPDTTPPPINDPVMPDSGALEATITDIVIPGRMMDINFSRTYRGDMDDPGFTHTFYSPAVGQKILLSSNQDIDQRPDEYDYPVPITLFSSGSSSNNGAVVLSPLPDYDYIFMQIMSCQWELDNDTFNADLGDPNDPNDVGVIEFDDYDGGSATVTSHYTVYGTNDPNGGNALLYFNHHPAGVLYSVHSRTFDYEFSRYAGRLGRKWDHSYNISLETVFDPNEFEADKYVLLGGDGKRLLFVQEPPIDYGIESTVFKCPSNTDAILHNTTGGFELHQKGGTIWKFNSDLQISAIEDINGNQITFSYSNGNLNKVTNDADGYIQFYYDSLNMIDYIEDSFGRQWHYNRNSYFELIEVVKPVLENGSTQDYVTNTYTYENEHNLLTMTDGAGVVWQQNIYDANDMIISQTYGDGDFDNVYHFRTDDPNLVDVVDYVYTTDRNGNGQTIYLTDTGLIRRRVVDLGGSETAITSYSYDFDDSGDAEMYSKCLVTEIEMPAGNIYAFTYDDWGNTTSVTHKISEFDPGLETQYSYSNNILSRLESVTDAAGNVTNLTYDTTGNVTKITLPLVTVSDPNDVDSTSDERPEYEFAYNDYGQVTSVYLPDGRTISYSYWNAVGKYWVKTVSFGGGVYEFDYDSRGNITSVTDPDGIETTYAYDNVNRLIEVVDALNSKTSMAYNDAGLVSETYQQLGASFDTTTAISSSFNYNKVDKLTSITDALGRITEFTLDDNDNVAAVTDPQGDVDGYSTDYSYNKLDQVASVQLPEDYDETAGNQNVTSVEYTVDGLVDTVTDAAGEETVYYYDGYRRLVKIEYPDLSTLEYSYDLNSRVLSEAKRDGSAVYYNYDALGRLVDKGIDPVDGDDVIGINNSLFDMLKTGSWTGFSDSTCVSGRYVTTSDTDGTYTVLGSEVGKYAVLLRWVSFGGSSNENVRVEFGEVLDPIATYYVDQQTVGEEWVYIGVADFDSLPQVRVCANGSPKVTSIDAAKFVPVRSFEYDAMGKLTKASGYRFEYDGAGRLETATDGFSRETSYEYTDAGRRSKMTWPDGFYVTYGYDLVGRLNAIHKNTGGTLWSCSYDEAGRRVQTTGVHGLVTDYDYEDVSTTLDDDRGLYLDSIDNTLGSLSLDYDYVRDAVGNITTKDAEGTKVDYLYDKNYSITSVDYETGDDLSFDYDNLSNWTSVVEGSTTTSYAQNALGLSQYSTIGTTSLTYDDNGNLTQYRTWHYLYDSESQMIATYNLTGDPNETIVSLYSYDDFGRRISKAVAEGVDATSGVLTESYIYDGFQVIGEYNTDGMHIKRRFIYAQGIDEPICMVVEPDHQGWYGLDEYSTIANSWLCDPNDTGYDSNADYYVDSFIDTDDLVEFISEYYLIDRPPPTTTKYYGYVFDGSGNVVAMTFCNDPNETGNPTETPFFAETYQYDPFGTPTIYDANSIEVSQSTIGNPYMFTARRLDSESGLYYYRLRMYNPTVGRFMQTDPIGYYDSMNMYQYCGNNPVNYIDPFGLVTSEEWKRSFISPIDANRARKASQEAQAATILKYGFNGGNDESDAFRHALWNVLMTRKIGYDGARDFATAHENFEKNPINEKCMDLHNNKAGRDAAIDPANRNLSPVKIVNNLLKDGKLVTSPKGTVDIDITNDYYKNNYGKDY